MGIENGCWVLSFAATGNHQRGKNTSLFLGTVMVLWFLDILRPRQWPQQFLR